jgi:small subunit ribosomal protein S24e
MKVNIVKRTKNPLLKREEIEFAVEESKAVPSRKEVAEKIGAQVNAKPGSVVIKLIETAFGSKAFRGKANVYDSVEEAKRVEPGFLIARTEGKKEEKPAAKPEEKKEEAKPEEKKEEKPAEAPKEEKAEEKKE